MKVEETVPLCAVHQRLEDSNELEISFGNGCVACSLNERIELLDVLAPFANLSKGDSVDTAKALAAAYRDIEAENARLRNVLQELYDDPNVPPGIRNYALASDRAGGVGEKITKSFTFYVDSRQYTVSEKTITRRDILTLDQRTHNYQLFLEQEGGKPDVPMYDDAPIDLGGTPKRFYAVPPATYAA